MAKNNAKGMMMPKGKGGKFGKGHNMGGGMAGDNYKGKGSKGNKSFCPMGFKNAFKK